MSINCGLPKHTIISGSAESIFGPQFIIPHRIEEVVFSSFAQQKLSAYIVSDLIEKSSLFDNIW
jgi:hypothetical protein